MYKFTFIFKIIKNKQYEQYFIYFFFNKWEVVWFTGFGLMDFSRRIVGDGLGNDKRQGFLFCLSTKAELTRIQKGFGFGGILREKNSNIILVIPCYSIHIWASSE